MTALTGLALPPVDAQVLDDTMVPRGRVRLQVAGIFESWNRRFGRLPDGSSTTELLGNDLSDPTGLGLYPGMGQLESAVRDITGDGSYAPVLGPTNGQITQDLTTIDWAVEIGVFDWLTIGGVLPWVRPRTEVDLFFTPDTINGNLGVSPLVTNSGAASGFLTASAQAATASQSAADATCSGGVTPECSTAQALAQRTREFDSAARMLYGATPLFPLAGSTSGTALSGEAQQLSDDLVAAGLTGLPAMVLATTRPTVEDLVTLPASAGSGIEGSALRTRPGLYAAGDLRLTARLRLLDNLTPEFVGDAGAAGNSGRSAIRGDGTTGAATPSRAAPTFQYHLSTSYLIRLPTGRPANPNILLDVGTGDRQMDHEVGVTGSLLIAGRVGLAAGARYGIQSSTTVTRRVAPPEEILAPASTQAELTWQPGRYLSAGAAPSLRLGDALILFGEYRYFEKARDEFSLISPDPTLDPVVLEMESGMKVHQIGGGLRYDTVSPWLRGETGVPMEVHVRLIQSIAGGGGHTPKTFQAEAGLRLFRRFWGPQR